MVGLINRTIDPYFDLSDYITPYPTPLEERPDRKNGQATLSFEAEFCRDYTCCGRALDDLHDLLQHYEDCHVRFDDEEEESLDVPALDSNSPSVESSAPSSPRSAAFDDNGRVVNATQAAMATGHLRSASTALAHLRASRDAICNVADLYGKDFSLLSAFDDSIIPTNSKKRTFDNFSQGINTLDLIQSNNKKISLSSTSSNDGDDDDSSPESSMPGTPGNQDDEFHVADGCLINNYHNKSFPHMSGQDLLRSDKDKPSYLLEQSVASADRSGERPYRCSLPGCDKSYKNANGLKYHKAHGHSGKNAARHLKAEAAVQAAGDVTHLDLSAVSTPGSVEEEDRRYACPIGLCDKRYKNMNGLKYHLGHTHQLNLQQLRDQQAARSAWHQMQTPGAISNASLCFLEA